MKDTRWIVRAAGVLAGGALFAWLLLTLFPLAFQHDVDAPEQTGGQVEPIEVSTEPDVYGVVKSVDLDHRRVTLAIGTEGGKEQEKTYDLAKDAEVLLEAPATLAELAPDTRVGLVFGPDRKDVVAIRSEPFRISVEPKQHKVEVGKPVDVILRVTNASATPQSFWVLRDSWDNHWSSSNPRVEWDTMFGNMAAALLVKLASGQVYEKTLAIKLMVPGRVSFKMGFKPATEADKSTIESRPIQFRSPMWFLTPIKRTYWSREVIVEVK